MSDKYSISEIVKFAIEIEKEGYLFYQDMVNKTENDELKSLFDFLKTEEKKHQEKFENLLDFLGADKNEYLFHSENEYIAYIHSYIEDVIFNKSKAKKMLDELKNDKDAVDYAIKKEEESIKYYENMKELTSKENVVMIDMIISEEKLHINKLMDIKIKL